MRILYFPIIALAAGLGAAAHAQLPFPFGPEPSPSERLQCTRDYVQSVEKQAAVLEKLHAAGPDAIGRICTLIEMGSSWLGGELPEGVRRELRSLLGVDVDLKRVTAQCRAGQDSIERELVGQLAHAKAELLRCTTI